MYARAKVVLTSLLVLLLSGSIALAQEYAPSPGRWAFAQQELDQMLAPIALYPDALLSQILMASTYPVEIVEAARWSRRNPGLNGDHAVRAVEQIDWDPSVKSLVAFPQILALMDEKLDWTERLGDAFLAQQADVMDTVQYLRQKAYMAGNLGSTDQLRVDWQGQAIVIELANPELIYVPYYNPLVVYGTWWWPTYQPVYWASWPGYYVRPGVLRGFAWGPGIRVSSNFFFGTTDWHRRSVHIANVNNHYYNPAHVRPRTDARSTSNVWQHNPARRPYVPHRDASSRQPSDHTSAVPEGRRDVRGHDTPAVQGRGGPGNRLDARGEHGSPPVAQVRPRQEVANLGARPNSERAPGGSNVPAAASQPEMRSATSHPAARATVNRPNVEQRPTAVDGVDHGANAHNSKVRGLASRHATAPGDSTVPASRPSARVAAPIPASTAAAPQPAVVDGAGHGANARKSNARGPATHHATAPGDSTTPASQPSGNVAAPIPANTAAASQPADDLRGNGRKPRHQ